MSVKVMKTLVVVDLQKDFYHPRARSTSRAANAFPPRWGVS